jgi:hypothetical protein
LAPSMTIPSCGGAASKPPQDHMALLLAQIADLSAEHD